MSMEKKSTAPLSIILADDDDLLRTNIAEILTQAGYLVREAKTGAEAAEIFTETPSDLIITDVFMPDMDGIELTRQLRTTGIKTRLLAMTGYIGDVDYLDIIQGLGANATLRKPFRSKNLLEMVDACFAKPAKTLCCG